jgi:pyrroline-5-carboxylate reductase
LKCILYSLGELFGLSADEANRAVLSMTAGAVKTMQESGLTPAGVIDLVPVKPLETRKISSGECMHHPSPDYMGN